MDRHYAPLGAHLMRAGTIVRQPAPETAPREPVAKVLEPEREMRVVGVNATTGKAVLEPVEE